MPNIRRRLIESAATVIAAILFVLPAYADVVTKADLQIQGSSLAVVDTVVTTQLGATAFVHTSFGGLQDDQAPVIEGLSAVGDLTGPGITTPIQIVTAPGHAFQISGLSQEGIYYLQNVRLMNGTQLLQLAVPSVAAIQVANTLKTTVTVRQLTPDEMRSRGINVDPSNYDVYEYTFSFLVNGQTVTVPYPVIINRTTHEPEPGVKEDPYNLPPDTQGAPPRWVPPSNGGIIILPDLLDDASGPDPPADPQHPKPRPQIHCAIVIPNSLAVLHQFFAVGLVVANGAPAGSNVKLDSVTASIDVPNQLRIAKVNPPTTFGQPVTIKDPNNPNVTFLIAQATGQADWTLEGLKPGTYTVNLDVKATFQSPGQPDLPLETKPQATVVIHDARFNITFSHPDTIRKDLQYSTYTYITNISDAAQTITLSDQGLPTCSSGGYLANVCRIDTSPSSFTLTLQPGETKSVQYKLQSSLTGHIFATAASIDGDNSAISAAAFQLVMGVSPTGVPLSPATLILPHYATTPYISQNLLDAELGYLGIAYSLATAPLNNQTAKFPRLITTDVFTRAVDLARAGERIFIGEDPRASLSNFTLDSLGNGTPLAEWDQFLRQEVTDVAGDTARGLESAIGAELSTAFSQTGGTFNDLADRFAASTTDRGPYVLALVHGAKSSTAASAFDVQITSSAGLVLGVDATQSSGWKRQIPWGGLFPLSGSVEAGTLAVIGRSNEALDLTITPSVSGAATIDLIFPAPDGVTLKRASAPFTATAGQAIHIHIANGNATSNDVALVGNPVPVAPISIVAARQDTFLDNDGHTVSVLFNRRLPATTADLAPDFDTDVVLDPSKFGVSYTGKRTVAGAALQPDRRIIHVNYDSALSSDVQYQIHTSNLVDPASNATVVPVVDVRNSALLLGTVLHGDNTIVPNAQLFLTTKTGRQYQRSDANGKFLFEYIPRDPDAFLNGAYEIVANAEGRQTILDGTVRLLHTLTQISVVFLGRGSAQGTVRYEDGTRVPNATVVVGSTLFREFRSTTTKSDGTFSVTDLPVGPLTFSAQDAAGNVAYAANELHAGGEIAVQDISIFRQPFPGVGTVYGRVIRNDTNAPVAGAHVGVYSQGYGFSEIFTDATGTFSFPKVPAGFVTVLAANFGISPTEVAVDFDLKANESHNMGDFILVIPTANTVMVSVDGDITAEDPLIPGSFHAVPNAQVQINGMPVVVANAAGHYRYDSVPQTMSGSKIAAYDPATRRGVKKSIPDLVPYSPTTPTNNIPLAITNTSGSGKGTIRVHLLSAAGQPIGGYHVFWSDSAQMWSATETDLGVYEFGDLAVGTTLPIIAAPVSGSDPTYGYQMTTGSATVSFPGQIAAITLRLKGQGTVTANIQQQTQAGVFIKLAGRLSASFTAWDNAELDTIVHTIFADTNGTTDAVFNKIPVLPTPALIQTVEAAGYASTGATIGYDGAVVQRTLILSTLAEVRGHVFAPDGYTPVAGAAVHMIDNSQDLGIAVTGFDGSFDYKNIVPSSHFTVTADYTINGIYRTAIATGSTPENGGVVDNVRVILQEQGSVEGTVVDSNNHPVPFAKIWLRELSYPYRELGTAADPRFTDGAGHFRFNNIFAVGVRVSAEDPVNPESRGDWGGAVTKENDVQTAAITLSSTGMGSVRITVLDPNNALAPVPNAEVSLYRGGLFDFGTTDASGSIQFDQLPVDNQSNYSATAFSKTQFKSGATTSNFAINKNQTTTTSIILTFSGEVNGNLVDPQNNNVPIPGSNVTLFGTYIGNYYQTRDTTAADGTFDFKGVREGNFTLEARDPNSIRMARGAGLVSAVFPTATIPLTLEPTSTLTVKAFLPNDAGGNSGVLAPLVNIDVIQTALGGTYLRSSQTNGAQFPGLVRTANDHRVPIDVTIHELGGLERVVNARTNFDANIAAKELAVIFSASGTVNVTVKAGSPPAPMANVQVTASGGGSGRSAYTDANGFVSLSGLPLGNVSIQATTQGSTPLTGSTAVALTSQTTPATANIILGSYDGITGKVIAEGTVSSPSAGTRVFANVGSTQLETRTDSTGAYTFQGIATPANGLTVHLIYIGPDDNTIGGQQDVTLLSGQGIVTAPDITLDSTPPRLIGIFPADGASKVAPDTQLKFTFNRTMRGDQLTSGGNGYFHLFDSAAGTELTMTLASAHVQPDNTEVITFNTPPKPAGQNFPLKSNTLYRVMISGTLLDLANHVLGADLGSSFTTSDYSAPQVTKVDPSPKQPLTKNGVRIGVTFSKPLDPAPWQSGGSGSMTFIQINSIGGQTIGSPIAGTVQLDPITGATLYYAPNVTLNPASFYRLSLSGVVDTDGRAMVDANGQPLSVYTQDFFTYDAVAPVVTIGTPLINGVAIGNSDPLYLSVLYTIPVTLLNPDGSAVTDLDRVDFWSVDASGNITPITKSSPTTVAIAAPPGTTTFTLRADAWDLSLNKGTATRSWTVAAQPPLTINSTTIAPATVYPGGSLTDTVQIGGGGLDANVTVTATLDGSTTTLVSAATSISRNLFTDPWPSAALSLTIPRSVAGGAKVNVTTSVSDIRGFSASPKADSITMATDAVAPTSQPVTIEVVRNVPATPALTFNNSDQYRVHGFASDAETGVASMTFTIDAATYTINTGASGSTFHSSTGVWEFVSPAITVQSHNNDAAIAINARASDYAGNSSSASASVTYLGIHDPNAPTVSWIAPLHDAAWPANVTNFTARLRVFASSPLPLTATFDVPGAGTLTATRTGNELNVTLSNFTTPAAGTAFQIVAHVSDGDGGHRIDLPINIDIVTTGQTIPSGGTIAVDATHPLVSDSVVVDGGRLILYVPTTLKNLIVIDGGIVDTVPSTTAADQKIDLTITDHLYVDGDSSIDVSRRGYMGGLEANADSSGSNTSPNGVTRGRVTTGGATNGASGSYAGIGGDDAGSTNATYGSITTPVDLGSGGAADSSSRRGGQGGGSAYIHAATGGLGKVVVAGALLGDGESGVNLGGAGSGGSIHVTANEIVLGATAKVSASGGDDDGSTGATRAGGGGRVSLEASQLLDIDSSNGTHVFALGGRNNAGETAGTLDGGAGTIFLRNAGEVNGELFLSALDSRFPSTAHLTRATPLAGTLTFDKVTLGARALARADASITIAGTADDKTKAAVDASAVLLLQNDQPTLTVTTNPAAGSNLIQGTPLGLTYTAASLAGVGGVTYTLAPAVAAHTDNLGYVPAPAQQTPSIVVPGGAAPGTATLTVRVTDRAGRTFDAAPSTFTIVANQAPVITNFALTAPNPLYIGNSISAAIAATDEVAVKTLSLTMQIGSGTPSTQTFTTNSASASTTFTVPIAKDPTLDGQTLTLTAKADDGVATVTQVKTVTIAHDGNPPVITITEPNAQTQPYTVDSGIPIHVVATVTDAESGVKPNTVIASIDGSASVMMTPTSTPNQYAGDLHTPTVPGSITVTRSVTVTAQDSLANSRSATAPVQITPHFDPTAPIVTFTCGSDGAIVSAGSQITLGVTAVPGSGGTAVSTVSFSDGTTTLPATLSGGVYSATYTVPSSAAPGSTITILATATTNGQGTGTQQVQLIVTSFDKTISSDLTIASSDTTTYDNKDVLITAGKVTIVGQHTFKKLVVLGGSVVPKSNDILHPDTISADTLYVACGASVDASSYSGRILGFARNTTYPGAGTPVFDSGGGHIGRGGAFVGRNFQPGVPGGTYGSIYRPLEPGSGGMTRDPAYDASAGGGVIRLTGSNVIVDGSLLANGQDAATYGGGAGGSIYVTATNISGGGLIEANGATWQSGSTNDSGAGGGGAISIEYGTSRGGILGKLVATTGNAAFPGAAGSVYVTGPQSTYGDLTISNGANSSSLPGNVITELPSFGTATVLSSPLTGTAIVDAMWEGPYLAGNWLRVTAPDGTVRGTWRIASVTNDVSVRTINGAVSVPTQSIAYDGYLMYSDAGHPAGTHVVAVRNNSGTWQYDNGGAFTSFTPQAGDVLFASFSASTAAITNVGTFTCPAAACAAVAGLPAAALVRGEVAMNAASGTYQIPSGATPPTASIVQANHSFFVHPDGDAHGVVLSGGPATVALVNGADVRAGDSVRGVYQFDSVTIKNARVYTPDLVVSTNAPSVDGISTFVYGNTAAPAIDTTKISVIAGNSGPIVVGQAGAVSDSDASASKPIELYVRNTARSNPPLSFPANSAVTFGTKGGLSAQKVPNGATSYGLAATTASSSTYAYVEGRPSQTNRHFDVLLTATPGAATPVGGQEYDWGIFDNGTCQVWLNANPVTGTFPYTTNTLFRIERTPANVYFYLDGQLKYTATVDARPRYAAMLFWDDGAELNSIDSGFDTPARFSGIAAANGSFTVPIYGTAGDGLSISARDRHTYPLTSAPATIASIPVAAVIAAPALSPNPVTGGHSVLGTVNLGSPAPAGGATVSLSSSSTSVTVPATVTIAAGATSATFSITTAVVTAPATATITATYGGGDYSTTLNIVVDNIPPSVSLTSPVASPTQQYGEGSGQIVVQATVTDAESGVASVTASLDGTQYAMTANGSVYSKTITAPFIDSTTPVTKQLTVTGVDRAGNSTPASVNIIINPIIDNAPPAVSWNCMGSGATLPASYQTKLSAIAIPSSSNNVVQNVVFSFDDGSASITASAAGSNVYEAAWTTSSTPKTVKVTVTATAAGGATSSAQTSVLVLVPDNLIQSGTSTISSANTQWESKVVVISGTGTTVTIDGQHNFAKLIVLDGATVVETSGVTNPLSLGTSTNLTDVYVGCGSAIDVSGRGYGANSSYPGASTPGDVNGGSHIGTGGIRNNPGASTFGSVYHPQEAGGGGNCTGTGGGVLHIQSASTVVDGSINARGNNSGGCGDRSAAGGSIWITTARIGGSGRIDTGAANTTWGSGGGGAIAIEYTDATSTLPTLASIAGTSSQGYPGGAGSIYVKGPSSTYGDLTVDNGSSFGTTNLPSFGSGTAQSGTGGATLVTGKPSAIPVYFAGNWIQIANGGVVKGIWRIGTINDTTVTLTPNSTETISLSPGDVWQGVYRFDNVMLRSVRLETAGTDPVLANGAETIYSGTVEHELINSASLLVRAGATLTHRQGNSLSITTSGETRIEPAAAIDVIGRGFSANVTYPGATAPGDVNGGSHMGVGGIRNAPGGSPYGSVYRPQELGGGGNCTGTGGGAVRIQSGSTVLDGNITSKGTNTGGCGDRSAAGGSVWITTGKISGAGKIDTSATNTTWGSGGGGAIAIEYTDPASSVPVLASATGTSSQGVPGGAGTIYVKGANATYGDLTVDNAGITGQATVLSSLGSGTAQTGTTGNTLVTGRSSAIQSYFSGNWVQVTSSGGTLRGTWRIATITNNTTVTLTPNGSETITLAPGDTWQGVYLFDNLRIQNGGRLNSADSVQSGGNLTVQGPVDLQSPITTTGNVTISGSVTAVQITAASLTVNSGAVLTQGNTDALRLTVSDTLTVNGSIDVSGHGFGPNSSYPGATTPGDVNGGSHIGIGGIRNSSGGSTFGSVYRPQEAGGGGNCSGTGGGVIRIQAANAINVNGTITAKGTNANGNCGDRTAAGGSIWITTGKISGSGRIDAGSNNTTWGAGGGGAIAIEYTDPTSSLPVLASATGTSSQGVPGGAGSIYVKGANATYGDLIVDNAGQSGQPTVLPSLGSGTAQAGTGGSTLVTDRSNIPAYFAGNWVQVSSGGLVKGIWRIGTVTPNSPTVSLTPNGSETISLAAGDAWRGVYRFDNVTLRGVRLETTGTDPLLAIGAETIDSGTVEHELINAASLRVRSGATLTHRQGNSLSITTSGETRVEGTGAIDVTGRGYTPNVSYPGATLPGDVNGGSHIGTGGIRNSAGGSTYGSVYRPQELGGGGNCAGTGGGAIRIQSGSTVVDGTINAKGNNANGSCSDRTAAGGSIWITTGKISGGGRIDTGSNNTTWGAGGGGAIAIEYTDPTSSVPVLASATGTSNQGYPGGAGSIYVKGANATYGDLTVDNAGQSGQPTVLSSLGSGTAQTGTSGNTLVTGRSSAIQPYFAGNWVQVTSSSGTLKGTWRIGSITNNTTVTLTPNGTETISLAPGDTWQGVYLFDNVTLRGIRLETTGTDPLLVANAETIDGGTVEHELIKAASLRVRSGTTLTHRQGNSLSITTSGETRIEATGAIDVTGRGYTPNVSYPGATAPGDVNGGSHMGIGGIRNAPGGSPYGSVYRPQELGGGGNCAGTGGGAVRIQSGSTVVDGTINAKGNNANGSCSDRTAAGGSVWITTGKISGAGRIDTSATNTTWGAGGGGAIAIEYTDPASTLPVLASATGTSSQGYPGGAGTIYVKGANATYGDLTVDNAGISGQPTVLSSLGSGTAQTGTSGNTLVTGRSSAIQPYFAGNWVQISSGGVVKGIWRIGTINNTTVTLTPNGTETISLSAGDAWQGVYRFDNVTLRNVRLETTGTDPLLVANAETIDGGTVEHELINAASLRVRSGTTLTHRQGNSLSITTSGETRVEATGAIDVTGRGYTPNVSYPGATLPGDVNGGSHMGVGGTRNAPGGSTFGSVYRPQELGGGGNCAGTGGGAVRIQSGSTVVDGTINAKGNNANGSCSDRTAAGGSVWITTGKISGAGRIDTSATNTTWGAGGGGAIAIEYTDPASTLPVLASATGTSSQGYPGGAGTIYVKGANATYGALTVDNAGLSGQPTVLPSLGSGTALTGTSGSTLVTDRTVDIPAYFVGHWVEISSGGTLKGTWRIGSVTSKTVTLTPNGAESISLSAGDTWQGVYRFDGKTVTTNTTLSSTDPIRLGTGGLSLPPAVQSLPSAGTTEQTPRPGGPSTGSVTIVTPVVVSEVRLDSASVQQGSAVYGVILLTAPAPLGGAMVALSSSDAAAVPLPATVIVPEGSIVASFMAITSCAGHDPGDVTITATYGTARSATVKITDCSNN